jgi:hypothetical protein
LARFIGINTRTALFFFVFFARACLGDVSAYGHRPYGMPLPLPLRFPLEKNRAAKLVVLLSDCKQEPGSESG